MTTAKQVREKLAARQDELGKVFAEAKTDDGSYDFNRVKCLGEDVKGSIAVAEKVKAMNAELDELAQQAEALEAAEKAADDHARREKAVGFRPGFPEGGSARAQAAMKSLGELLAEAKTYNAWIERGCPAGIDLTFDILPTDMLAMGMKAMTLQEKALMATTAGYAPESVRMPGFVEAVTRPLQLIDIIPFSPTGQASIKYMEETTRTHAAAETAEGGSYAESTFVFTEKSSDVRKITDSLPVTDEQLDDVPMMQGYVNGRLAFGIRQRLDTQVYVGNGTAPNLRGIVNVSGIQTQARGTDPVPDVFFKAMTKVRTVGRAIPTHHVMHPTDWQSIRLLRTADGVYIWGSPSEAGPERLWGLPVVQNEARASGSGLTGSFQPAWISGFERRGVDIQIGYVGTQFTEGKRTVRGDMRAGLVVFRPAAFCDVTGL
ncbi:phage major capsid protein [Polymorphum gilvum]|uniref:Phage major capsid protein, HK97 n=1 Tax=Polymorphum gilvum (strain LMG 25793 / CGMCC 1.9160 / SL003B-26A1) TaxID=991905 RepID=F2J5M6_POLGS|nr:phage major capsid protein [Polymorphum gilvum]ADZ70110.1 Phage major capsid protein, HK97 [Polymorphum gilvum SL003B-26A1]